MQCEGYQSSTEARGLFLKPSTTTGMATIWEELVTQATARRAEAEPAPDAEDPAEDKGPREEAVVDLSLIHI